MRQLARRWPWLVLLTAAWVLLQGEATAGNLLGGLAASILVLALAPLSIERRRHRIHVLGLVRYLGFVAWSLVTSSIDVVRTSLVPTPPRLRSGIVRCELPGASPLVTTLVANAITLTPGTLTLAADASTDPAVLHVHVLGLGDVEDFRAQIADLHRRATAAVAPSLDDPRAAAPPQAGAP
jgi:multicomponent Na+:H+ antiporter subunit E